MEGRSLERASAVGEMDADNTILVEDTCNSEVDDDEDLDPSVESEEDEDGSESEERDGSDGLVSGVDSEDESEGSSYIDNDSSSEGPVSAISETGSNDAANESVKPDQTRTAVATLTRRLLAEKSTVVSIWKDILESITDLDASTSGCVESENSESSDLPPLPQGWASELMVESAKIDSKRLLKALETLHGSMSNIFDNLYDSNSHPKRARQTRAEYHSMRRAREKALMRVAKEHLAKPSDFEKQVQNLLNSFPRFKRLSKKFAIESARSKVSKDIIMNLGADGTKAALEKVERVTNELLAHPLPNRGFSVRRAAHYASLDVASTLVEQCIFDHQVDGDARVFTKKSDWLTTHEKEAIEASKRSVASEILKAVPEQKMAVVEAQLAETTEKYLKQWKADTSRTLSDAQVSQKWNRARRDALMVIAAEYVPALQKYRMDLASRGRLIVKMGENRRRQEYRIAVKVIDGLESNDRNDSLLRAEALAVALTEAYIEDKKWRPGRGSFLESIVPLNSNGDCDTISSHQDASDDEKISSDGDIVEDDAEMPEPKRMKMGA